MGCSRDNAFRESILYHISTYAVLSHTQTHIAFPPCKRSTYKDAHQHQCYVLNFDTDHLIVSDSTCLAWSCCSVMQSKHTSIMHIHIYIPCARRRILWEAELTHFSSKEYNKRKKKKIVLKNWLSSILCQIQYFWAQSNAQADK